MAAGAGLYRRKTYGDAYLAIKISGSPPNYIDGLQDAETQKGLSAELNFFREYCVGRDRAGGENAYRNEGDLLRRQKLYGWFGPSRSQLQTQGATMRAQDSIAR